MVAYRKKTGNNFDESVTKYKCFIIQTEQNTTPKYNWNKIKCDKMQKITTKYKWNKIQIQQNINITKYKCNKIQIEQNEKVPKYKLDKIQNTNCQSTNGTRYK